METSQTKPTYPSKQRRHRFWISRIVLLLGLPLLLYYAYCWGFWGRNSLLLQLLFQCGCPVSNNESRYPDKVDVVVPACRHNEVILSPSGRLLYVNRNIIWNDVSYLWNLQTDERISYTIPNGSNYFLTDDLIFHEGDEYILDRVTGKQYPIQEFAYWHSDTYMNGEINLSVLAEFLRNAKDVFLINDDAVVALAQDFKVHPELNFFIHRATFPGREANRAEKFLQQNNIAYAYIPDRYSHEAISPNGKFVARPDGIYLVETDQKIVEGFSATGDYRSYSGRYFMVIGWIYDGSGVIYSKIGNICLIEINFFEGAGCFIKVSQPVLKLKVPQEYLPPAP